MIELGELLTSGLFFSAFCFTAAVGLVIVQQFGWYRSPVQAALASVGLFVTSGLALFLMFDAAWELWVAPALGVALALASHRFLHDFTPAGRLLLVTNVQVQLFGVLWGVWFICTIPISSVTRTLMLAGLAFLVLTVPTRLLTALEHWEVLCRRRWMRPRRPLPPVRREHYPQVSLHVPACSEPPEIVIATLNALSWLDYPNFEVIVIDNNTKDARLWRPVEAHCQSLGERFRFFHVDRLSGAKAGALNFALRHTAPDAELVGVIDSDYQAEPGFLIRLVGYFDDPKTGFVQTPHDYREWQHSRYLRMCYWEYRFFFETEMVSLNEQDAAITVGTMCLIRRKTLEEVGGWAEWCATEDSELAIRIHAAGYSGIYLNTTFGRGLIPETFSGYKRQRFRWTAGPVQELKRHFRLYLPKARGDRNTLTTAQKLHHANHGLSRLNIGLLLLPLGIGVVASLVAHKEWVPIPFVLWLVTPLLLMAGLALRWLIYRAVMGSSLQDALGALLAVMALSHTVALASFWALFTRSIPWRRTNKFKALPLGLGALADVRVELLLGLATLLFAIGSVVAQPQLYLHFLLIIGVIFQSFNYFAAVALAILAERDLRLQQASSVVQPLVFQTVPASGGHLCDEGEE